MHTSLGHDVASIASNLGDGGIHIWLIDYHRSQQRRPLQALLGVYLSLPAEAVILIDGEHGRPDLAPPWNQVLQFNWSHSVDKAIIAITRHVAPGIDIECIRPRPRAMQLAERFFHPEEVAALQALDKHRREIAFLQLWTSKEAVLKALGRGVTFGLHRLHLSVASESPDLLWLDGDDATQWQLHCLKIDCDHVASLAWRGPSLAVDIWTLAENG
ncbi:4'-phosphopantetheinyl transferase superfamily protein [Dyella sp. M7H15-1]|uniref:4'-phosphopantetheinyl transferase family protein n=1 Tax=Dyella sp. M7H15-1 TaxID=2501295 RepID=UPI001004DE89|nr:4'-phosphopantetheinyl transferase superfamily protein [Dyella sp. M7H15-1]QAU24571.1 4'-phosphopantetheinyl transferase superfamily protein [Dyella sp. M7H15-1]